MRHYLEHFATSESGAITVDWVVLTGGLVALALAMFATFSGGVEDLSGEIQSSLGAQDVGNGSGFLTPIITGGDILAD